MTHLSVPPGPHYQHPPLPAGLGPCETSSHWWGHAPSWSHPQILLSALEEQLCSCCSLMHIFKAAFPETVRALAKSDEYFYCYAQASTGFMRRFKCREVAEHHVAL